MNWRETVQQAEAALGPLSAIFGRFDEQHTDILKACRLARDIDALDGLDAEGERWRADALADLTAHIAFRLGWYRHQTEGSMGPFPTDFVLKAIHRELVLLRKRNRKNKAESEAAADRYADIRERYLASARKPHIKTQAEACEDSDLEERNVRRAFLPDKLPRPREL